MHAGIQLTQQVDAVEERVEAQVPGTFACWQGEHRRVGGLQRARGGVESVTVQLPAPQ